MIAQRNPAADLDDPRLVRVAQAIMTALLSAGSGTRFRALDWGQICSRHRAGENEVGVFFDAAEAAIKAVYDA